MKDHKEDPLPHDDDEPVIISMEAYRQANPLPDDHPPEPTDDKDPRPTRPSGPAGTMPCDGRPAGRPEDLSEKKT